MYYTRTHMIEVKEYRGHIRNWEMLCHELEIYEALGYSTELLENENTQDVPEQGIMAASVTEVPVTDKAMTRKEREEAILIKAYEKWGCIWQV